MNLRQNTFLIICLLSSCPATASGLPSTAYYECSGGPAFVARFEDQTAWLFLNAGTLELPQVKAASGARYEAGGKLLWSKGSEATLDLGSDRRFQCSNYFRRAVWEHAKLNGADFRAVGNEPGWALEISAANGIELVADYGQSRHHFPYVEPQTNASIRATLYETENSDHRLSATLIQQRCNDTMSGEAFEAAVILKLDGKNYLGCGRALH